jgi:sigma-E factor negative regulatory protein RseC
MISDNIRESARVVSVDDNRLWVEARHEGHCGACSAQKSCGHRLLGKALHRDAHSIEVVVKPSESLQGIKAGDLVDISLPGKTILQLSLMFYLIPLLAMALSAGFADALGAAEGMVVMSGIVGVSLSFFWLKRTAARRATNPACTAVFAGRSQGPTHQESIP